jgi:hypothetical protein
VGVVEAELDEVVRQCLHLLAYAEPVPEDLLVLIGLLEVQRVEPLRNAVVFAQSLLSSQHGESPPGADLDHQQLVLTLVARVQILDLPHREHHAVLARSIEVEPLLADPLDAVGPRKFIRFEVDLTDDEPLILFVELPTEVGVDHIVDPFEFDRGIAQIELQFILDGVPLCIFGVDLLVLLQIVLLQIEH